MATLIKSTELDVAALFPQCFDNQFVCFNDFRDIATNRLSYKHEQIAIRRNTRTLMEINRALVYGEQVCVNRASLPNCKPLYELYLPYFVVDGQIKTNPRYDIDAFGTLLGKRAIIPYLFQGTTLEGDGHFNMDIEGQRALAHLLERHEQRISFLTLGADAKEIQKTAARISLDFESRTQRLGSVIQNEALHHNLLAEVLPCADLVENADAAKQVRNAVMRMRRFINEKQNQRDETESSEPRMVSREDLYRLLLAPKCVCSHSKCSCVADGQFNLSSSDLEVGTAFCLKTLIDLVYTSNVPDILHRYLMTPWRLPTRNALQDNAPPELQQAATIDDVAEAVFSSSRRFHASTSEAMYLPVLDQLTLTDICSIRELPQWREFMSAQERMLQDALDSAANFDEFQATFESLQSAISRYCTSRYFEGSRGKKYVSFVSGVFQIGKYALKFGVRSLVKGPEVVFLDMLIDYVSKQSERVPVGPARLLFEVFDSETRELDAARSWSTEWMRKTVAWSQVELLDLLKAERNRAADIVLHSTERPADISGA